MGRVNGIVRVMGKERHGAGNLLIEQESFRAVMIPSKVVMFVIVATLLSAR
jgi:hypothetical protein